MIKVLNVISDSNIGGAGRVLINYLRNANKEEFETYIAVPKASLLTNALIEVGGKVIEIDGLAERSYSKDDVKLLEKIISELKPDIVHTHGALSGRIAARKCGCRVIYTRHSVFPVPAKLKYPPGRWVNKFVNEHYADHIIAVSEAAKENLTDAGISGKLISVVLNGVSPVARCSKEKIKEVKTNYGIKEEDYVISLVARIEDYKGHAYAVCAASKLKAQGRPFKMIFAGSGGYEDAVRKMLMDEGLEEDVIMTGFIQNVSDILSISDVQLNASYGTEATSLSLLEGFSMGLPAVVSNFGGNPYVVENGINGLVFESKNADALCSALCSLMDNPAKLKDMGEEALRSYNERFSGEVFAKNIEEIYKQTLKGARK